MIMNGICNELTEVEYDGGFGICGENGHESYDDFIYPLVWIITKKVRDNCDDLFGSFRENG